MHKAISDQIIKYVLNSNENVRIEKIKNVFGLTDRQFNLIKFYIKKHRPNDFYNFLNKIDGTELEKSEYPMHIYVPTVCLNEKLEKEELLKRFNLTKRQFNDILANLNKSDKELHLKFKEYLNKHKSYIKIGNKILKSDASNINDLLGELNFDSRSQINSVLKTLKNKDQNYFNTVNNKVIKLDNYIFDDIYNYVIKHNCGYYQLCHAFDITDLEINVILFQNKEKNENKVAIIKEILKNNKSEDKNMYEQCNALFKNKALLNDLYYFILKKNMTYKDISKHFDVRYTALERFINKTLKKKDLIMYNKIKTHYK